MSPTTPIGQGLRLAPWRLWLACFVGWTVVEIDFLLIGRKIVPRISVFPLGPDSHHPARAWLPLAALLLVPLVNFDRFSLGLRWRPIQGWSYWVRWSLGAGIGVGLFSTLVVGLVLLISPRDIIDPLRALAFPVHELPEQFLHACVKWPLIEEVVYRILFCVPAVVLIGQRGAIIANGFVFAILHILYGNPSPDNQIAGFFFAYAYLRSGCILVPLALHAAGNLLGLVFLMGAWELGWSA